MYSARSLGDRDIGGIAPLRDQDAPILGTLFRGSKVRQCPPI